MSNSCNPMNCSMPDFPVHRQFPKIAQTHVHRVGDAIKPSHPLSSSSPAFNLSQHQGIFQSISSLHLICGQSMGSTGEWNGKPLQYPCLENLMNSKKWQKDMIGPKRVQNLARKILLRIILFDLRLCLLDLQGWQLHFSDPVGLSYYACTSSRQDW